MEKHIVIGIEGLVGAGKTSICRELLNIIPNTKLLNGGNLYRSIVYTYMKKGDKIKDLEAKGKSLDIYELMNALGIEIKFENKESFFYVDGEKLSEEALQSKESSLAVSKVGGSANNESLFKFARGLIDNLKKDSNVIIAGRSIMKIYPDTDYHFFITADLEERVKRKCTQYENKEEYEAIKENIIERDALQEKAGFYDLDPKSIVIDVTDCKSVKESTEKVLEKIKL